MERRRRRQQAEATAREAGRVGGVDPRLAPLPLEPRDAVRVEPEHEVEVDREARPLHRVRDAVAELGVRARPGQLQREHARVHRVARARQRDGGVDGTPLRRGGRAPPRGELDGVEPGRVDAVADAGGEGRLEGGDERRRQESVVAADDRDGQPMVRRVRPEAVQQLAWQIHGVVRRKQQHGRRWRGAPRRLQAQRRAQLSRHVQQPRKRKPRVRRDARQCMALLHEPERDGESHRALFAPTAANAAASTTALRDRPQQRAHRVRRPHEIDRQKERQQHSARNHGAATLTCDQRCPPATAAGRQRPPRARRRRGELGQQRAAHQPADAEQAEPAQQHVERDECDADTGVRARRLEPRRTQEAHAVQQRRRAAGQREVGGAQRMLAVVQPDGHTAEHGGVV